MLTERMTDAACASSPLAPRAAGERLVDRVWLVACVASALWLVCATAVAYGAAPELLAENLWAWAVVPFASWGFYGVLAPRWVGTLIALVVLAAFASGLAHTARLAARHGLRTAVATAARGLGHGLELALVALLGAVTLAFGTMAFAHTPRHTLGAMVVTGVAAILTGSAFTQVARRVAPEGPRRWLLRLTIVWLGAEAIRSLLAAFGLVEAGAIAARVLLAIPWLATGGRDRRVGTPGFARVAVATVALVPVLFAHRGNYDDFDFGPRAPISCEAVARQPGVLRVFGPERGFGPVTFYDVLVVPERRLAVMSLKWDERLAFIDLEQATVEFLPLVSTPPAPTPRNPTLTNLDHDPATSRLFVANGCLPDEPSGCPSLWEIDLDTHGRRAFTVPGSFRSTGVCFVPARNAIVLTPDWQENLAIIDLASGTSRVLERPDTYFWQSLVEPRSARVLLGNTRFGRQLLALDVANGTIAPVADVGRVVSGLALDEARNRLYLGRPLLSRIDVRDASTFALEAQLAAPFGVREIAVDPAHGWLVAGSFHEADVMVVRTDSGASGIVAAGGPVRGVAIDPTRARGYFASPCGLVEIDLAAIAPTRGAAEPLRHD